MTRTFRIGEWTFDPDAAALFRAGDRKRIENRAAAVLAYLCERPGEIVSKNDLIGHVWSGRALSPNSAAVVVADLRRALGDDARAPKYIETVAKRGYRIVAEVVEQTGEPATLSSEPFAAVPVVASGDWKRVLNRPLLAAAALAALTGVAALTASQSLSGTAEHTLVALGPFANETEQAQHAPLSKSVVELVATEIGRHDDIRLLTRDASRADYIVRGTLILWDGHPALALYAENPANGQLIWSGMASGPESELPRQVRIELEEFAQTLSSKSANSAGSARAAK